MVNYENGQIYKLVSEDNEVYYGSTCQKYLSNRLSGHKTASKTNVNISSKKLFEKSTPKIYLVESFPCKTKFELETRERYYIENNECVNQVIPTRTEKEWREANKELITEKSKQTYQDNKEKINSKCVKYYQENKEEIIEQKKQYQELNKDKIKKYYEENKESIDIRRSKKMICICGSEHSINAKSKHLKTLKHLSFLK